MPAGSEAPGATTGLPVTFRPLGVRIATIVFGVLLVGTVVATWLALSDDMQEQFSPVQKATIIGFGLIALVGGHALARCRVDAADDGLTVVNGYRSHHLAWQQVVAVTLRPGSPWAVLDLSDGTTRSALGIQGSDGARAVRHTRQLRALVESHSAPDPRG